MKPTTLKFIREMPRLMLAPVVIGIVALALYLLGTVPAYLQGITGIREYNSIEEAEVELGFEIYVPAYFPSYLSWPPAEIKGQLDPVPMVQMLFLSRDQLTGALLINEMISNREDLPMALPWIDTVLQEMPVVINSNGGRLVIGESADGQRVNGVSWTADGLNLVMVMKHPVQELLTLARSMR